MLYAFRYSQCDPDYYSLFYLERDPRAPFTGRSTEVGALLESKGLAGKRVVLICSEKLTPDDEKWREIKMGEMIVISRDLEVSPPVSIVLKKPHWQGKTRNTKVV